jgi:hypothetical protein
MQQQIGNSNTGCGVCRTIAGQIESVRNETIHVDRRDTT